MAKKIMKENQRYHQTDLYLLLSLFSAILLLELLQPVFAQQSKDLSHWGIFTVLFISFGIIWWLVLQARLQIKVSKSALSVRRSPFFSKRHKLPFKQMKAVSFISVSQAAKTSGWGVNLGSNAKLFSFGDTQGIHILMENGEEFTIFSDQLYERRQVLEKIIGAEKIK